MGKKRKEEPECLFCLRKLTKNICSLRSPKCQKNFIKEKLASYINPEDFSLINNSEFFPDPKICTSCFNLINSIHKNVTKIEALTGQTVNFNLTTKMTCDNEEILPVLQQDYSFNLDDSVAKNRTEARKSPIDEDLDFRSLENKRDTGHDEETSSTKLSQFYKDNMKINVVRGQENSDDSGEETDNYYEEQHEAIDNVKKDFIKTSVPHDVLDSSSKQVQCLRSWSGRVCHEENMKTNLIKGQENGDNREEETDNYYKEENEMMVNICQSFKEATVSQNMLHSSSKQLPRLRPRSKICHQAGKLLNNCSQNRIVELPMTREIDSTDPVIKLKKRTKRRCQKISKESLNDDRITEDNIDQITAMYKISDEKQLHKDCNMKRSVTENAEKIKIKRKHSGCSDPDEKKQTSNVEDDISEAQVNCKACFAKGTVKCQPDIKKDNVDGKGKENCSVCEAKVSLPDPPVGNPNWKPYKCTFSNCNREYVNAKCLAEHRLTHEIKLPHTCPYPECGKGFLRPRNLRIHITLHTGEKPYSCEFHGCGKQFRLKNQYNIHQRLHTGERPYKCTYQGCDKTFNQSSSFKLHKSSHSSEQPYCCEECGKRFSHVRYLKLHKLSHKKKSEESSQTPFSNSIPCEVCGKMFSSKLSVRRHVDFVHKRIKPTAKSDVEYVCDISNCGKTFRWKSCMVRHKALKHRKESYKHQGKFVNYICDIKECGQEFNRNKLLKEHISRVHGKKPEGGNPKTFKEWLCFQCGMAVLKKQMTRHFDTYHSHDSIFNNEKKGIFSCKTELCEMSFQSSEELRTHIKSHVDNPPYACLKEGCQKTFLLKKNFNLHMNIHNKIKPFHCKDDGCSKTFATQLCLMRHSIEHNGEVYKCPFESCCAQFRSMMNAGGHIAAHQGEDPYVCGLCGAVFTVYGLWARHKKKHTCEASITLSGNDCRKEKVQLTTN